MSTLAPITTISLDVDGVLARWLAALFKLLDLNEAHVRAAWAAHDPKRPWDVFQVLDMSAREGWHAIDNAGAAFWADIEPHAWAQDLYSLCSQYAQTTLVTSPSYHPSSYAGKAEWINRHFSKSASRLIGNCKPHCAHAGALLIDDSPTNCTQFVQAGGRALLFPGLGNDLHPFADDPMPYVRAQLRLHFGPQLH